MSSVGMLGCLLAALGAPSPSAESSTSTASSANQRTIEIIVAGPEDARNQIMATIQPLVPMAPDLRWVTQASRPADDAPPSSEEGVAQIWIDVSNLTQVRVYLPEKARGETAMRTLESTGSGAEDVDPMAREAVAQIVKASVLALREMPDESGGENPAGVVAAPRVSSPESAHVHDGLYLRLQSGLGYLRTSESYNGGSDLFFGVGPTLNAAVGGAVVEDLILYGAIRMTVLRNADELRNDMIVWDYGQTGRDLLLLGVGPGVAFQLPFNSYVSGTLLLSKLWYMDANADNPPPDTNWGLGGSIAVGKEWWLSANWGIGLAAQFDDAVMPHPLVIYPTKNPESISPLLNAMNFALVMSATYN